MQQDFCRGELLLGCDPYLPELDTPHGGERQPREEDAVIRCHRPQ